MRRLAFLPAVALLAFLPAAPATAATGLVAFQSPSGNIGCMMDSSVARCDIRSHTWKTPSKPKSCELDYGQGMTISRSSTRGRFVCAGDTALSNGRRLAYGHTIRRGDLQCTSRASGMTCKNARGHGFRLAKKSYRRF